MTFVLMFCSTSLHAAPQNEIDLNEESVLEQENIDTESESDHRGVIITQPTPSKEPEKNTYYYPYRQSMSPRLGLLLDPDMLRDGDLPLIIGVRYLIPRRRSPQWEVGFDVVTEEGAHISVGKRFIGHLRQPFRPYIVIGAMLSAQAEERLATFTDIDNYFAKASVGFEDVIKLPMSVRLEIEFAVGLERQFAMVNFGYSWGW